MSIYRNIYIQYYIYMPSTSYSEATASRASFHLLQTCIPSLDRNAVMPLDVLGRTRATLTGPASTSPWPRGLGNLVKPCRAGDRALQLLLFNEECLVGTSHQLVPITSLPFVHTARRYYRLNGSVRPSDWLRGVGNDRPEPESWSNLVI